jgi:cyanate permease
MRGRLHYAWVVAGITFLILMASAGIRATPGVLMVPLEQELGWSRATTSTSVSIGILLYGLVGPFCAAIARRVGIRRTMAGAMAVLAVAVLLATRVRAPWQLILLWGVFVGTGTGMVATVMGAVVVNRWFGGAADWCWARSPPARPRASSCSCRCWRAWPSTRGGDGRSTWWAPPRS